MLKKGMSLAPRFFGRDPFFLLRQFAPEFDRAFEGSRWPSLFDRGTPEPPAWMPEIDVLEKDNRLLTKVDLPGMKKPDVKVEISDGHLIISGERKRETEETKDQFYRSEREYGYFYRAIPLPEGVKLDDVKATFSDGVLEVSVPLPAIVEAKVRKIEIQEPQKSVKTAA